MSITFTKKSKINDVIRISSFKGKLIYLLNNKKLINYEEEPIENILDMDGYGNEIVLLRSESKILEYYNYGKKEFEIEGNIRKIFLDSFIFVLYDDESLSIHKKEDFGVVRKFENVFDLKILKESIILCKEDKIEVLEKNEGFKSICEIEGQLCFSSNDIFCIKDKDNVLQLYDKGKKVESSTLLSLIKEDYSENPKFYCSKEGVQIYFSGDEFHYIINDKEVQIENDNENLLVRNTADYDIIPIKDLIINNSVGVLFDDNVLVEYDIEGADQVKNIQSIKSYSIDEEKNSSTDDSSIGKQLYQSDYLLDNEYSIDQETQEKIQQFAKGSNSFDLKYPSPKKPENQINEVDVTASKNNIEKESSYPEFEETNDQKIEEKESETPDNESNQNDFSLKKISLLNHAALTKETEINESKMNDQKKAQSNAFDFSQSKSALFNPAGSKSIFAKSPGSKSIFSSHKSADVKNDSIFSSQKSADVKNDSIFSSHKSADVKNDSIFSSQKPADVKNDSIFTSNKESIYSQRNDNNASLFSDKDPLKTNNTKASQSAFTSIKSSLFSVNKNSSLNSTKTESLHSKNTISNKKEEPEKPKSAKSTLTDILNGELNQLSNDFSLLSINTYQLPSSNTSFEQIDYLSIYDKIKHYELLKKSNALNTILKLHEPINYKNYNKYVDKKINEIKIINLTNRRKKKVFYFNKAYDQIINDQIEIEKEEKQEFRNFPDLSRLNLSDIDPDKMDMNEILKKYEKIIEQEDDLKNLTKSLSKSLNISQNESSQTQNVNNSLNNDLNHLNFNDQKNSKQQVNFNPPAQTDPMNNTALSTSPNNFGQKTAFSSLFKKQDDFLKKMQQKK